MLIRDLVMLASLLLEAKAVLVRGFFDHFLFGKENGFPQTQRLQYEDWITEGDNSAIPRGGSINHMKKKG